MHRLYFTLSQNHKWIVRVWARKLNVFLGGRNEKVAIRFSWHRYFWNAVAVVDSGGSDLNYLWIKKNDEINISFELLVCAFHVHFSKVNATTATWYGKNDGAHNGHKFVKIPYHLSPSPNSISRFPFEDWLLSKWIFLLEMRYGRDLTTIFLIKFLAHFDNFSMSIFGLFLKSRGCKYRFISCCFKNKFRKTIPFSLK